MRELKKHKIAVLKTTRKASLKYQDLKKGKKRVEKKTMKLKETSAEDSKNRLLC